jgi:hypothetical protein
LTLWTGPSDLAYAIGLSWAPDVQALLVSDTLNAYYEGLLAHGVSGYRWEDLLTDYRLGLVRAVGVPANWCAVPEAREKPWLMAPMLKIAPAIARLPWIEPLWLWPQKPLRFGVTQVRLEV